MSENSCCENSRDKKSCNDCDKDQCKNLMLAKVTKHYINSNVQYINDDWFNPETLNSWGIVALQEDPCCPANVYWVANNGSNTLCKYFRSGQLLEKSVVKGGSPTGLVDNYTKFYRNYKLITVTLNGTIEGLKVDSNNKAAASTEIIIENKTEVKKYTGVDLNKQRLYVCDFLNGVIEMYDNDFNFIKNFTDDALVQSGYHPYNVAVDGKYVYVTFAKKNRGKDCAEPGIGYGYVDIFSRDGSLLYRFISRDPLNAPWGLTFSECGKYLYVGNHGDGKINIFDSCTKEFIGPVMDKNCNPVQIGGLWGITLNLNRLIFASGIDGSDNCGLNASGLIGYLRLID